MSNAVTVTLALADGCLTARSRLAAHDGPEALLSAPGVAQGSAAWWDSSESHELVLEALALLHLPRIDTLVFAFADDHSAAGERLQRRYIGTHVVRNTECRSQTLSVCVQAVALAADRLPPRAK